MGGSVGLSESQEKTMERLEKKLLDGKSLTLLQQGEIDKLIDLEANPQLPQGAKTYCQDWLMEQKEYYNRRKDISSWQMEKGHLCEPWSISFLNAKLLTNYEKNEEFKQDEWMQGTCDIDTGTKIIDIKNSSEYSTFPLFDKGIKNKTYEWQLLGYMSLWDRDEAELIYTLMNLPDHLIEQKAKQTAYKNNCDIDEVYQEVRAYHTYDDVPTKLRYKIFPIKKDEKKVEQIKARVEECQKYINKLIEDAA